DHRLADQCIGWLDFMDKKCQTLIDLMRDIVQQHSEISMPNVGAMALKLGVLDKIGGYVGIGEYRLPRFETDKDREAHFQSCLQMVKP
ncbi:hypothetical protein ACI3PL_20775, partial [Lacticaseibacillus paracasei]